MNDVVKVDHIIEQSETLIKLSKIVTVGGALGTWMTENAQVISLTIVFLGYLTGLFFSRRKDKYLAEQNERHRVEHEARMTRRKTDTESSTNGDI
tara:strand:- start:183 stop:467 length:285 start_codon:yes stop_codon:yes gene_type:complete